jgi:hypothetical protein
VKRRDQRAPNRCVVEESVDEHERRPGFLLWVHDETSFLLWFSRCNFLRSVKVGGEGYAPVGTE